MSISLSTHVLDVERGRPAAGVRVELLRGDEQIGLGETDSDGRIADLATSLDPGAYRLVFTPPSPFFQASRARARAGERPLPRALARLLLLVRDLPRQLTARDELAELFEGRTRSSRSSPLQDDPLGSAREVIAGLTRGREARGADAHPAIGAKSLSARSAAEQGERRRPRRAGRARRPEPGLRGEVRLPLRRLRQPAAEGGDPPEFCASGSSGRARKSSTPPWTSSSRSRRTGGVARSVRRVRDRLAQPAPALAARHRRRSPGSAPSFYFIALDNHLRPPKDAQDARRGVGGEAWEIHGGGFYHVQKYLVAPRVLPEHAALVQVGGVHDLAQRLRADDRPLLPATRTRT